jgi:hypothetical protein
MPVLCAVHFTICIVERGSERATLDNAEPTRMYPELFLPLLKDNL